MSEIITGNTTGSVTEAGGVSNGTAGTPTATGDLDAAGGTQPDSWNVVSTTATTSGYGSYAVGADGKWTYTLADGNGSVEALNVGDTLTDTFTATTADGTMQLVTVTINGANDAAVITGLDGTPSFTEGGAAVVLDSNATVSDPELSAANNYAGASLTL